MKNPMGYCDSDINAVLRFKSGARKISFRYKLLNKHDKYLGNIDGVEAASISHGEFRTIKRSARIIINECRKREINFLNEQIQPWFILHMPQGGTVEWPLGIFLSDSPDRERSLGRTVRDIGMCDKTLIVEQDVFMRRFHFEAGTNYVTAVTRILNTAGITKINISDTDHVLLSDREYKIGAKKHLACNELLREINFTSLWVDPYGVMRAGPYIPPTQRSISHTYDTGSGSIVAPPVLEKLDVANRPNVFIRVAVNQGQEEELISTAINDRPESPLSTVSRGRRIVDYNTIDEIASQEALDALVARIAIESTSAYTQFAFDTALTPTHGNAETLWCNFPSLYRSSFKCHEVGWEMPLKYDGVMRHTARMLVHL